MSEGRGKCPTLGLLVSAATLIICHSPPDDHSRLIMLSSPFVLPAFPLLPFAVPFRGSSKYRLSSVVCRIRRSHSLGPFIVLALYLRPVVTFRRRLVTNANL